MPKLRSRFPPTLSGDRGPKDRKHREDQESEITHSADLRQVGLTVLDSQGWHKVERPMTNYWLLLGPKAVMLEGQVSL